MLSTRLLLRVWLGHKVRCIDIKVLQRFLTIMLRLTPMAASSTQIKSGHLGWHGRWINISSWTRERCLLDTTHKIGTLRHMLEIGHVVVWRKINEPSLREDFKTRWYLLPLLLYLMIVRAMCLCAMKTVSTWVKFKIVWMILLLLPSMAMITFVLVWAAIFVGANKWAGSPVWTLVFRVLVKLWLPPEVLPVVGKYTHVSLMLSLVVGTPHCLKMKHVEVKVFIKLIYQFNWDLSFRMCKWTIVTILTFTSIIDVWGAEFSFILIWMVEFFNPVVWLGTMFPLGAFFTFCNNRAHLWLVST